MSVVLPSFKTIDLANCDREPIHIPGYVQPHGALLAMDLQGNLTHRSDNAEAIFGAPLPFGQPPAAVFAASGSLKPAFEQALVDALTEHQGAARASEITFEGEKHDVVIHAYDGRVLLEVERWKSQHGSISDFVLLAHRTMARLRNRTDIDAMIQEVVSTVSEVTGFDRVMVYKFHFDDSGEIVSEKCASGLTPYLGRRFPAADIPPQARRLYTLNTLRLISDVNDTQVAIEAADSQTAPLDLSHSVLRSVSPIHIEYLKNIGVAASMSLSIVVDGRLWGLIACHHRTPHRVPYPVRMACDVLAQMVSASVHAAQERAGLALRATAEALRSRLKEVILHREDLLQGFVNERSAITQVLPCDASLFAYMGKVKQTGEPVEAPIQRLLAWLNNQSDDLVVLHRRSSLPEEMRDAMHPWCGVLALCFDRVHGGWIVLLRRARTNTITWSGPIDKVARIGPLGARLTPDGSFAEWQQSVEGTTQPWTSDEHEMARSLLDELSRAASVRRAETERARAHLLVVLGHDLRDPIHSIGIAARILERDSASARIGQRIAVSANRMERLITQVLDISRLQGGLGLGLKLEPCDMAALVQTSIEELNFAYPDVKVNASLPESAMALLDADRFVQVLSNLLSNARQHSSSGAPISVSLISTEAGITLYVRNEGTPIPDDVVPRLFDPMKIGSQNNPRNPTGLGMGLYIAKEIVAGHGGTLSYSYSAPEVTFAVSIGRK
jgi:chemotaxis family two-component system sensor kinase Cph1